MLDRRNRLSSSSIPTTLGAGTGADADVDVGVDGAATDALETGALDVGENCGRSAR